MARRYHLLLASLPHVAGFERLKALPIGSERFEARLALLDPDDARIVATLRAALWPEREAMRLAPGCDVALSGSAAAIAARAAEIRAAFARRRDDPDPAEIERARLAAIWAAADRLTAPHGFDLDAVLRAVVRWDVATAWLAADASAAAARIDALADGLHASWRLDAAA